MSLISMEFLLFVILAVAGYYWIPGKYQWIWLLVFSYIYYASGGIRVTCFLVFTTITSWAAGAWMEKAAEEIKDKRKAKQKKRQILTVALVLNFGVLGVLKYTNFAIDTANSLFGAEFSTLQLLLPLGISFYTFQSMGYILDVYWGRGKAEHNLFRFALFVSFFPQILQGPIGRFGSLSRQLYASHTFEKKRMEQGILRILWGYFKKMVIADNAVIFVDAIFDHPDIYNGLGIVGVLAYSIQLYCDFSGGMDVVIGIAELFGIRLDENFKRPYFAVSITDFWHRWHITLGTWMKDYVFYPVSLSGWTKSFSKFAKKTFGKQTGRTLPICLANLIVFLVVGIWHGAAWKFIIYGLYNGLIIAFSGLMAPSYRKWKTALHISDDSSWFHLFQMFRTFLLVNISWFFDRADDVKTAVLMMKNTLTHFNLRQILEPGIEIGEASGTTFTLVALGVILGGCLLLFVVSVLEEQGKDLAEIFTRQHWIVKGVIYLGLILLLPALGQPSERRVDLYMHSFKKILLLVVGILALVGINLGLNYGLIPYSYVRIMMHQIETQEYDTLLLGTSHGLNGISPKVIEEKTGKKTMNLCLGGEYPRDAYYLLKQACEKSIPETVVYELDPGYFCTPEGQRGDFNRIFYEMPFSVTKVEYFFAKEAEIDFRASLFPWFYYRNQFRNAREIIAVKQGEDYKNYGAAAFQCEGQSYADGFLRNQAAPGMKPESLELWDEKAKNEDSFQYFEKIASFCRKKNIELLVVVTPVPRETLEKYGENFQQADEFFTEYCKELGVEYKNYNRPGRKIKDFDDSLNAFTDYEGHMSAGQAEAFSAQMAEDVLSH